MSIETISLVLYLTIGFLVYQFIYIVYLGSELKKLKPPKYNLLQGYINAHPGLRDSAKPVTYAELSEMRSDFEKYKEYNLKKDRAIQDQLTKLEAAVAYPKEMSTLDFQLAMEQAAWGCTPRMESIPLSKVVQMLVDKAGLEIQQNPAKPAGTVFVKKKR